MIDLRKILKVKKPILLQASELLFFVLNMDMTQVIGWMVLILSMGIVGLTIVKVNYRALIAFAVILINTVLSTIPSINAITTATQTGILSIPHFTGDLLIKIDSLSAWFILIINFTAITGVIYGSGYLKAYSSLKTNLGLHWAFYMLFHLSMILVCMFDSGIAFLVSWELMSLSSLMLVIFEFQNKKTLKAGINYMVQMHLSVALLTLGFILLYINTGSFDFEALARAPLNNHFRWIYFLLFAGFAIKAGFIPFHSWLPHAHPAAPSHISGVMSGVIVKLGIYGILRIMMYLRHEWVLFGEIIVALSVLTAIYGIANAALRFDFKQMLAFCTIENIGIIGIGIGIGLMGIGNNDQTMAVLGFGGALLHTLNHSLFKSLLFFSAGNVYQQTHTRNIERLGGLIKKMPFTAVMFLIGSLAIGGIPPFNGFVSEFIIYNGLFKGLIGFQGISQLILFVLTIIGLVIAGGMSLLTFTKTFGIIFLGNPRQELDHTPKESSFIMLLPQYFIVAAMMSVAIFPRFFFSHAARIISGSFPSLAPVADESLIPVFDNISNTGMISLAFVVLPAVLFGIRWLIIRNRPVVRTETWGCGYVAPVPKAQYSGQSFTRSFGMLFSFMVREKKKSKKIPKTEIFPAQQSFATHYVDILEKYFIFPVVKRITFALNYFQFIQNGQIQSYVLYGLFFVILVFLGTAFNFIQ